MEPVALSPGHPRQAAQRAPAGHGGNAFALFTASLGLEEPGDAPFREHSEPQRESPSLLGGLATPGHQHLPSLLSPACWKRELCDQLRVSGKPFYQRGNPEGKMLCLCFSVGVRDAAKDKGSQKRRAGRGQSRTRTEQEGAPRGWLEAGLLGFAPCVPAS